MADMVPPHERVRLVPTTAEHVERYSGTMPPWRIKSITALRGDEVLGFGGIGFLPDGTTAGFIEASEEACRKHPITLYKAVQKIIAQARAAGVKRMVTHCDTSREAAERFLERIGFRFFAHWNGQDIWVWEDGK
jgi:hypothetical protein